MGCLVRSAPPGSLFNPWIPSFAGVPAVLPNFFSMAVTPVNLGDYGSTPSNIYATYDECIIPGMLPSFSPELYHTSRIKPHGRKLEHQPSEGSNVINFEAPYNASQLFPITSAQTIGNPPSQNTSKLLKKKDLGKGNKKKIDSGITYCDKDKVIIEGEKEPEEDKQKSPARISVRKQKKGNKYRRKKTKSKIAQIKWLEYKTLHVPAFRYRNVFKCILRNMHSYTNENKEKLMDTLLGKGYPRDCIVDTFKEIEQFKPREFPCEIVRRPKIKIDEILRQRSPRLHILREVLQYMLDRLLNNEFLQVHNSNRPIYIEACEDYIKRANAVLDN